MTANEPKTLMEAMRYFADPDVALDFVAALRWPNGPVCPTCGSVEVRFISTRRLWECKEKHPRKQFSVKIGTIMEDSPISLDKWLAVIWMVANDKNGISSYEVARSIGVTQKSAWFMLQRIRLAMQDGSFDKFSGEVEADETFIGGKARNMSKNRRAARGGKRGMVGKAVVMGILERHGPDGHSRVRTEHVADTRRRTIESAIRASVEQGANLYTDEFGSYRFLGVDDEYLHEAVSHAAEEYVRDRVHTNGIENFWSLLKRSLGGTYVSVEPFHLFRYIDEQAFRFNNRKVTDGVRFLRAAAGIMGKRLTYAQLTGAEAQTTA